ncbi:unnamed protein product [Nippostrongylus brasiliensis]|uniref:Secreted protein n=1 Tax=Nippostrongylus brasiliensis TaxID=27835 RepID=A0A0N4XJT3_NIPBR|nr:unnamed protein product [Nippostrongylus brasiliensis]
MQNMLLIALSALLPICSVAFDGPLPIFEELAFSNQVVKQAFAQVSDDDIYGTCDPNLLDQAQRKFNTDLGINTDLTWRNASSLNYAVNKLINTGKVENFVNVCKFPLPLTFSFSARRDYVGVLLSTYPFCVNRFFLLQQGNTDFNNAVTYVHLFKHLEFICSTAFDVYQMSLPCIIGVSAHNDVYNACFYKFQQTINAMPNMLCE